MYKSLPKRDLFEWSEHVQTEMQALLEGLGERAAQSNLHISYH